jgi:hypothetical protein
MTLDKFSKDDHAWGGFVLLEDEVVCISRRRCKHYDHRDQPVLKKSHERRIEWFIAGPEL